jgi:hypothetical protein
MRTTLSVTLGLAVIGVVAAGVVTAQAQGAGARHGDARSFTVVEHAVSDTTTDTGAPGDSVGDLLTFANPVFDASDRTQVGTDNGSCIRTVAGHAYQCSWTTTLAGGSLVVEGPFYDDRDSVLAVTGGTGRYATARGEMRLHARDAQGSAYDFTFRVR